MPKLTHRLLQRLVNRLNQAKGISAAEYDRGEQFYTALCLEELRRQMGICFPGRTGLDIVDVGCGVGTVALELAQEGHSVMGIDIHRPSLKVARQRVERSGDKIDLREGDVLTILKQLPEAGQDVAVAMGVLYTCVGFRDIVVEMKRVLRRGGLLLATFRSRYYFITTLLRQGRHKEAVFVANNADGVLRLAKLPAYYNWHSADGIRKMFNEMGLDLVSMLPAGVFSGTGRDGMAAVADPGAAKNASALAALHDLERHAAGPYLDTARSLVAIGRKLDA